MAAGEYIPSGASGLQQGGQMQQNINAMSDQAKQIAATRPAAMEAQTAQNLQSAFGPGEIQALNHKIASHLMRDVEIDPDDPRGYLQAGASRIAEMKKLSESAKKSGNQAAAATYDQVAGVLSQHLNDLHGKYAAKLRAEAETAAQRDVQLKQAQTDRAAGKL